MAILLLEALVQAVDRLLDVIHQLILIFLDGTTNLGANEEGVELGENSEHFVCSLSSGESVSEPGDDGVLYSGRTFVVKVLGSYPSLPALIRDIQQVNILKSLPSLLDFLYSINIAHLLHNNTIRSSCLSHTWNNGLGSKNGHNSALKLLVVVTESADIIDSCLELRMLLDDLDRDELLVSSTCHLTSYISEFFDILFPSFENLFTSVHDVPELLVIKVDQFSTWQQPVKHIVEVCGDGLDKGKSPTNRVWADSQLLVQMSKDLMNGLLNLGQRGGGQQLIKGKVSHQLVVLLHFIHSLLQTGIGCETDGSLEALGMLKDVQCQENTFAAKLALNSL